MVVRKRTGRTKGTKGTKVAVAVPKPGAFTFNRQTVRTTYNHGPKKVLMLAFNKHIGTELQERVNQPMMQGVTGTMEQQLFWDVLLNEDCHVMGVAVAGAGKTFTAVHGMQLYKEKFKGDVEVVVKTYHAHGMAAVNKVAREQGKRLEVNQWLIEDWLKARGIRDKDDWREVMGLVKKLIAVVKGSLVEDHDDEELARLADWYELDTNGLFKVAVPYVWEYVKWSGAEVRREITFDDMPWLPVRMGLDLGSWDLVIVDEFQDTNPVQARMLEMMVGKGARVVVLGDPRQAIYAFRGADTRAMANAKTMLMKTREVKELGLTYTRRCGKKIVGFVQGIVPGIHAMPEAEEGKVRVMARDKGADGKVIARTEEEMRLASIKEMQEGDMVVCRCNAPLIEVAYGCLKRGVKAVIRGREIGTALSGLVEDKLTGDTAVEFKVSLESWYAAESEKLGRLGERGEQKRAALGDKMDCLVELMATIEVNRDGEGKEVESFKKLMVARINGLFADVDESGQKRVGVLCGTVHKLKGLEADKVWLVRPDLIPHPKVKKDSWQYEQELNILYVAGTRARKELVVVGWVPGVEGLEKWEGKEKQEV